MEREIKKIDLLRKLLDQWNRADIKVMRLANNKDNEQFHIELAVRDSIEELLWEFFQLFTRDEIVTAKNKLETRDRFCEQISNN